MKDVYGFLTFEKVIKIIEKKTDARVHIQSEPPFSDPKA